MTNLPKLPSIRKVLILGSGAIKIGEAAEFDYSGSQCLKALQEEGVETVVVNPNIATVQTDPELAGQVYLLPVTAEYVTEVIRREKPDGIVLGFGGQTALNCGMELAKTGRLEELGVKILGTPARAIEITEDRALFRSAMKQAGVPVPQSETANSVDDALGVADEIGYPVIVRAAYTLGGKGSGVARNSEQLRLAAHEGIAQSPIGQVLVEEYLGGWKELEYEVMRDSANNCLIICNMENFDPMGIHTGDSIVVAPSQTLSNEEYHLLRSESIRVIQKLGIVGECNIQWALDPKSGQYRAIEVNARMSRSSALASKATGYPLAYIAAKLAIGFLLPELRNKVTGATCAFFEPALDYIVVKIPRWDFQKFRNVDPHLGPAMKSIGEVMAIGRCFEEALQKAVRMLDNGREGLLESKQTLESRDKITQALSHPTDTRLFEVAHALEAEFEISEISSLTGIDPWFLEKLKNIVETKRELRYHSLDSLPKELLSLAKRLGFSDSQIAAFLSATTQDIRDLRKKWELIPVVKQIDTMAAEWPAQTNYLYLTYGGEDDDIAFKSGKKAIVLGSGVFRIGSSVEFDWCAVNTTRFLKECGIEETIMINYNPETVSTDYDSSDKLYFEELTVERIMDIYEKEQPMGIVVNAGGQIPNNLAHSLTRAGAVILGTSSESIDVAEDRAKFSALLDSLGIAQPKWSALTGKEEARLFANQIEYPVLIRPSYVLSGSAMRVAYNESELDAHLDLASSVSREHPVVISKFVRNAKEVDVDGVCDGERVIIGAIIEHIEKAGIHSGDACMTIPPQTLKQSTMKTIDYNSRRIALALGIRGPFNIQYLVSGEKVMVIECNLRASRTMPFVSKTWGTNLMELAAHVVVEGKLPPEDKPMTFTIPHVGVKVPQFSFVRLKGADPVLGVEMVSTGEVACLGDNLADALTKALEAAEIKIPAANGTVLLTVAGQEYKRQIIPLAKRLQKIGMRIYATENTYESFRLVPGMHVEVLHKVSTPEIKPNIRDFLLEKKIDLVINIPVASESQQDSGVLQDEYTIRRLAIESNIPVVTSMELAWAMVRAIEYRTCTTPEVKALNEFVPSQRRKFPLRSQDPEQ